MDAENLAMLRSNRLRALNIGDGLASVTWPRAAAWFGHKAGAELTRQNSGPKRFMLAVDRISAYTFLSNDVEFDMVDLSSAVRNNPAAASALTKATLRSAALLGLNNATLARIVGVSESHVSRMVRGEREFELGTKPAELATLLVRVYRSLDALVGNSEQHRRLWMASFNRAFNEAPKDAVQRVEGLARVVRYLDSARAVI